jgi:hypothetical protein
MSDNLVCRIGVGVAVVAGLLLIWINLAVGIIGSEDNPANAMYLAVLTVGFIRAVISRLRPRGMSRALYATVPAQILVPVIGLILWKPTLAEPPGMAGVFVLNAFFTALFVVSALLFQRASETDQH